MERTPNSGIAVFILWIIIALALSGMPAMHVEAVNGSFGGGDGSETNPFIIEDVWDLQNMNLNLSANYALGNDIDASATRDWNSGAGFEPIGTSAHPFKERLDGRDHIITDLYINRPSAEGVGLFGYCLPFSVSNLRLLNVTVIGNDTVGGLAGYLWGYWGRNAIVSNVHVSGNVTGTADVGGLLGALNYVSVYDSYFLGNRSSVRGNRLVGGLAGVIGPGVNVRRSYAVGAVAGYTGAGGLVGLNNMGIVTTSYASGNVTGFERVGGLAGWLKSGVISDSYALGSATGTGKRVGGLVGWNENGTISDTFAAGTVTGASETGGLVGNRTDRGATNDCFWDTQTSGAGQSAGGTGCTTAEMKTRSTFTDAGWDFDRVWSIVDNVTYPFLMWQDVASPIARAGPDLRVDEDTLVTLDGSGSWDDFGIFNYSWSVKNDVQFWLYGVRPSCRFLEPGQYIVTLTVTDAGGRSDTDVLVVDVSDITPPVADAGPDQVVGEGTLVYFDGGASIDNVGIIDYIWTFTDGVLVTLDGVSPTYRFDTLGTYVVTLNVTDSSGNWATDTMTVTVRDITRPTAEAGPDQTVDEGTLVEFDGSMSSDDIGVVNWTWTFTDGALVVLHGAGPTYRFDTPGTFLVTLNVTDAAGNWATDDVTVTVLDVTPPVADAGPDQTVDEGTLVTFDGSGSSDNSEIVQYIWTVPDVVLLILYGTHPTHRFDIPGLYVVTLNVTDAAGLWSTDTMTVMVSDVTPPVAYAGQNQTVEVGSLVTFNGSHSIDNVGIVNYTWTLPYVFNTTLYGAQPTFLFTIPGSFVITLNVTDAAGRWDTDTMTVGVRESTPPVAVAGPDRTVPVGSNISFDGSFSSDNYWISIYEWTFTYDSKPQTLFGKKVQYTFGMGGVYEVLLTVTDAWFNVGNDTVVITVVDTGLVTGTVLDEDGRPVKGATVEINASDGRVYPTTTSANGSFALDVFHGGFNWTISKEGYRSLTGVSSVEPMGATELDLSGDPLVKEDDGGESMSTDAWLMVVVVVCVVAIVVLVVLRRMRSGSHPG